MLSLSLLFMILALTCALLAAFSVRTIGANGPAWLPLAFALFVLTFIVRAYP